MISNEDQYKILQIETLICEQLLDMDPPVLIFSRHPELMTATTKAMAVVGKNQRPTIYINPHTDFSPEIVLYVGHELRHIYQFYELQLTKEFEDYKSSKSLATEEYNLQWLEVDANAFGAICMIEITHCKPLWNGLTGKVKAAIEKRQQEIIEEEFEVSR